MKKTSGVSIHIQFRGRIFNIAIGHQTMWFGQIPFITFTEEWYDEFGVVGYATMLWDFPKYKQKR